MSRRRSAAMLRYAFVYVCVRVPVCVCVLTVCVCVCVVKLAVVARRLKSHVLSLYIACKYVYMLYVGGASACAAIQPDLRKYGEYNTKKSVYRGLSESGLTPSGRCHRPTHTADRIDTDASCPS